MYYAYIMSQRDIRPSNTLINVFIIWADLDFQCPHKITGISGFYFQMVHNSIAKYDTPSLHTAIEMFSKKPG